MSYSVSGWRGVAYFSFQKIEVIAVISKDGHIPSAT